MCRVSSDSLRGISLQGLLTYSVLFFFAGSVEIGLRLDALKHNHFLVLRS